MSAFDFTPFAVGGATRPDSFSGMQDAFRSALSAMLAAAPPEIQPHLQVASGYRSPERQSELWQGALAKYGSPDAARKWVAPPGKSQHNHGSAADLRYLDDTARAWAHENAKNFGLHFPLSNENWHIELMGARDGEATPAVAPQMAENPAPRPNSSVFGDIFAQMAPRPAAFEPSAPAMTADFGSADASALPALGAQGRQRASGLLSALQPDIERLLGVGKRAVLA